MKTAVLFCSLLLGSIAFADKGSEELYKALKVQPERIEEDWEDIVVYQKSVAGLTCTSTASFEVPGISYRCVVDLERFSKDDAQFMMMEAVDFKNKKTVPVAKEQFPVVSVDRYSAGPLICDVDNYAGGLRMLSFSCRFFGQN